MTVTYTAEVATTSLGCFLKLLVRWKGSIYKLLWKDFLIFLGAYYSLSFTYRFALNENQRITFENVAMYCDSFNNLIPVAFVLGFYVSVVLSRWSNQFNSIPWPDRTGLFVTALIHGHDERGRLMRRTIMRYLCLAFTLTLTSISCAVKKRFPTLDHITDAGIMMPNEQAILEDIKTPHSKYFIPLVWATSLISRARKEGRIKDDFAVKTLIDEINSFRGSLGTLFNYDWISVPLVYTQVVTLAVYTFFLSCLMGRQFLNPRDKPEHRTGDFYVPVFTLLQFMFYMGWLKVAETLVNPFGEDDDDFEINWVIDRNLQVSYLVVDEMHSEFPELIRDAYWDEIDFRLPYTVAAESYRMSPHLGSAADINIEPKQAEFVPMESIQEDVTFDNYYQQNKEAETADVHEQAGEDVADKPMSRGRPMTRLISMDSAVSSRVSLARFLKRANSKTSSRRGRDSNPSVAAMSSNRPSPRLPEEEIFQMSDLDIRDDADRDSRGTGRRESRTLRMEPPFRVPRQPSFESNSTLEAESPPKLSRALPQDISGFGRPTPLSTPVRQVDKAVETTGVQIPSVPTGLSDVINIPTESASAPSVLPGVTVTSRGPPVTSDPTPRAAVASRSLPVKPGERGDGPAVLKEDVV